MATEVTMPQMGESIAEGTIVRWIKKVGDTVDRDEPLFEISTDKVDAEIPSPAAGVLTEIKVNEGETVAVNSVVAMIGEAGAAAVAPPTPAPPPPASHADGEAPGRPRGGPRCPACRGTARAPAAVTLAKSRIHGCRDQRRRVETGAILAAGAPHRSRAQCGCFRHTGLGTRRACNEERYSRARKESGNRNQDAAWASCQPGTRPG
jgi:pyruvate/2-oxoglutarate dehydrogenase complex dihydrolipoamide acyltransferase (E2) component